MAKKVKKVECITCGVLILPATAKRNDGQCAPCVKRFDKKREMQIHNAEPGCPECDGSEIISFNWQFAFDNRESEVFKYLKYLHKKNELKVGSKYTCDVCGQYWYLDGTGQFMTFVSEERQLKIEIWNKTQLLPPEKLIPTFAAIGGVLFDSGYCGKELHVPVRAVMKSGEVFDKALVSIQAEAPVAPYQKKIYFIDQVKEILPSPYALSLDVRKATHDSEEVRMGFAPTAVRTPKGETYILNNQRNYFDFKGIRGPDLRLDSEFELDMDRLPPVLNEDWEQMEFIIADMPLGMY